MKASAPRPAAVSQGSPLEHDDSPNTPSSSTVEHDDSPSTPSSWLMKVSLSMRSGSLKASSSSASCPSTSVSTGASPKSSQSTSQHNWRPATHDSGQAAVSGPPRVAGGAGTSTSLSKPSGCLDKQRWRKATSRSKCAATRVPDPPATSVHRHRRPALHRRKELACIATNDSLSVTVPGTCCSACIWRRAARSLEASTLAASKSRFSLC
mmetsp:Transcript_82022/g.175617  ORF Transcript_82022/g.175617 Transcript_82022/m.175617 type:complete len:209 (-) Transcript_82022:703-1329(-)